MGSDKTSIFINKAGLIHSLDYDYSTVNYINSYTKVSIKCNRCLIVFSQTPNKHLFGQGCRRCGFVKGSLKQTSTIEEFTTKADNIHNNLYDYSDSIYIKNDIKMRIKCKACDEFFEQTPKGHLSGKGCIRCGIKSLSSSLSMGLDRFIEKASNIHNNLYDYSDSIYINSGTKLNIRCKTHKIFTQTPDNHIYKKQGCPICNRSNNSIKNAIKNKELYQTQIRFIYLYKFYNDKETFYKFGITKDIKTRFRSIKRIGYMIELIDSYKSNNYDIAFLERYNLERFEQYCPENKFSGYTECFKPRPEYCLSRLKILTKYRKGWLENNMIMI